MFIDLLKRKHMEKKEGEKKKEKKGGKKGGEKKEKVKDIKMNSRTKKEGGKFLSGG